MEFKIITTATTVMPQQFSHVVNMSRPHRAEVTAIPAKRTICVLHIHKRPG